MNNKKNFKMNIGFNKEEEQKYIKSYMFIKGYALAKNLTQTLIALAFARRLHDGQYRKDGMPYIVHPLKVCSTLINYGIDDDIVLAASLLHDVVEDCKERLPLLGKELVIEHGVAQEVLDIVLLLTKESGLSQEELAAILGVVGILLAVFSKPKDGKMEGIAIGGLVCSIIGLVLGIILTICNVATMNSPEYSEIMDEYLEYIMEETYE